MTTKIGLALGGGAKRGYAIFPIIKRLEKEGIEIKAISGSSAGALIAAHYALHGEVDSLFEYGKKTTKRGWLKLMDPNNPKLSLIKGHKIKQFLVKHYFGNKTFKDTKIPLIICAVDLIKKKPVYIHSGELVDAVMASVSVPGVVPPYKIKKDLYIDGGVLDPVPTRPLLEKGLKKVVGINLMGYSYINKKHDKGLIPTLFNIFYMMMEQLAKREQSRRLFMLEPMFTADAATMFAMYKWKEPHDIGLNYINKRIKDLKKWLKS